MQRDKYAHLSTGSEGEERADHMIGRAKSVTTTLLTASKRQRAELRSNQQPWRAARNQKGPYTQKMLRGDFRNRRLEARL